MPFNRRTEPKKPSETDLADAKMGRNSLQGKDQSAVRNQRRTMPDTRQEADDVIESFRKLDKDYRAKKDLGKGSRKRKG